MPKVNPEILVWARRTAGLTVEDAVQHLDIKDSRDISSTEKLLNLESGETEPSRSMLLRMVQTYRRPLLVFYMTEPPRKGDRGQDFRTLPDDYSESDDALIDVLLRNILARQRTLRAALEDDEDVGPLGFIGSARITDGFANVLRLLHELLETDHREFYNQSDPDKAFALLRSRAERAGIFVLLIGNLGSHHTAIKLEVFRGFALADNIAPFVVLNDQDSHSAWSFSLLHEITHLLLGQSGISGRSISEQELERFCNDIAGEFLLPNDEISLLKVSNNTPFNTARELISQFAGERNLSSSMVAYKLLRIGTIDRPKWARLSAEFRERWLQSKAKNKPANDDNKEGGPSYYLIRRHRVGKTLVKLVDRMLITGALSTTKAALVLGVRAKNVQNLINI